METGAGSEINLNDVDNMGIDEVMDYFITRNIDMPDLDDLEEMKVKIRSLIKSSKPSAEDNTNVSIIFTIQYSTFLSCKTTLIRVVISYNFLIFAIINASFNNRFIGLFVDCKLIPAMFRSDTYSNLNNLWFTFLLQKNPAMENVLHTDNAMKQELGKLYDLVISFMESKMNADILEPLLKLYEDSFDLEARKNDLLYAERAIVVAGLFV